METIGAHVESQSLRQVPRPFPADHERALLLKHVGLHAESVNLIPIAAPATTIGPILPQLLLTSFCVLTPIWRWLSSLD